MSALADPTKPLPIMTVTIQIKRALAVRLTHKTDRSVEETGVTLWPQSGEEARTFEDL